MSLGGKGTAFFVWMVVFTVLCSVALLLRWWSARIRGRKFYVDDGLLIVAWIITLAFEGTTLWALFNGMGQTEASLTPDELVVQFKDVVAAMVCWTLATVLVKLAILFLYLRVFAISRVFTGLATALMFATICFGITYFGFAMTTCVPLSHLWQPVPGGHCRDLQRQEIGSIAPNIFIDFCIVVLPMPWLVSLQMRSPSAKAWVLAMFSLGFVTIGIMCYRLYKAVHPSPDAIVAEAEQGIFSFLELWIGIIVACMPTLTPVFVSYVLPLVNRIRSRLGLSRGTTASGSASGATSGSSAVYPLETIGGGRPRGVAGSGGSSGGRRKKPSAKRGRWTELGGSLGTDNATNAADDRRAGGGGGGDEASGTLRLVDPANLARLETNCTGPGPEDPDPGPVPPSRDGIYVQQQFQTHADERV